MTTSSQFFDEMAGQPEALRRLAAYYEGPEGGARLASLPAAPPSLLLGMGASYHSSLFAAHELRQHGLMGRALEATEALYVETGALKQARGVVYVSQWGARGGVRPLRERLGPSTHVTAVTNDDHSPLAQLAQTV